MTRKDQGVVLRCGRSGETSKHITFLGRDSGKIKLLGKGALGTKSAFRSVLEAGNVIEVVYHYKEGRTLYFLKEANTVCALRHDESLTRVATALAMLELIDQVAYWGHPESRIVDLFLGFQTSPDINDGLLMFLGFEFKLLEILGVLPDFSNCTVCSKDFDAGFYHPSDGSSVCREHGSPSSQQVSLNTDTRSLLSVVENNTLTELASMHVDPVSRKRLGKILHWTYTFHIQGYRLPEALKLIPKNEKQ